MIRVLDLSLSTPYLNLACDEALLLTCESGQTAPVLRFWEPERYFLVLGHANKAYVEADVEACLQKNIPILRRSSGGGAVLNGPGCLNYTLVLPIQPEGPTSKVNQTYTYILARQKRALQTLLKKEIEIRGISDLAINNRKFSGNAQRRKKKHILFHGTLLLDFNLALIPDVLPFPTQQPDYRNSRTHLDFLTNLHLPAEQVKAALQNEWQAHPSCEFVPYDLIEQLVQDKYSQDEWNFKF